MSANDRPEWGDVQMDALIERAQARLKASRLGKSMARETEADILVIRDLVTALEQTRTALAEEEMRARVLTGLYRSAEREAMQHRRSPLEDEVKRAEDAEPVKVDSARRRKATRGDVTLYGVGVVDQRNGPWHLAFQVEGIPTPVLLDTDEWKVEWADEAPEDAELVAYEQAQEYAAQVIRGASNFAKEMRYQTRVAWMRGYEARAPQPAKPIEDADQDADEFRFTDEEWRRYQAIPSQGYSHRGFIENIVNSRRHPAKPIEVSDLMVEAARDAYFDADGEASMRAAIEAALKEMNR